MSGRRERGWPDSRPAARGGGAATARRARARGAGRSTGGSTREAAGRSPRGLRGRTRELSQREMAGGRPRLRRGRPAQPSQRRGALGTCPPALPTCRRRPLRGPSGSPAPRGHPLHRGRLHPEDRAVRGGHSGHDGCAHALRHGRIRQPQAPESCLGGGRPARLLRSALSRARLRARLRPARPAPDPSPARRSPGPRPSPAHRWRTSSPPSAATQRPTAPAQQRPSSASRSTPSGPRQRLVVELDSWEFHRHRAAFERDRARDAALQAAGYRTIRITHRRLHEEAAPASRAPSYDRLSRQQIWVGVERLVLFRERRRGQPIAARKS